MILFRRTSPAGRNRHTSWGAARLCLLLGLVLAATAAAAQEAPPAAGRGQRQGATARTGGPATAAGASDAARPAVPQRELPADSVTVHSVDVPGRTLKFKATAGSIPLLSPGGRTLAEIAYVSYQLEGTEALKRPVTFAFNGGPGSASAWVHIGGFGPWRLPLDGPAAAPSAVPVLLPNAETWLDFTDLVFIDPVGTGFSRLTQAPDSGAAAGPTTPAVPQGGSSGGGSRAQGGPRFFYSAMPHPSPRSWLNGCARTAAWHRRSSWLVRVTVGSGGQKCWRPCRASSASGSMALC
jgi:hypothetical protein